MKDARRERRTGVAFSDCLEQVLRAARSAAGDDGDALVEDNRGWVWTGG